MKYTHTSYIHVDMLSQLCTLFTLLLWKHELKSRGDSYRQVHFLAVEYSPLPNVYGRDLLESKYYSGKRWKQIFCLQHRTLISLTSRFMYYMRLENTTFARFNVTSGKHVNAHFWIQIKRKITLLVEQVRIQIMKLSPLVYGAVPD